MCFILTSMCSAPLRSHVDTCLIVSHVGLWFLILAKWAQVSCSYDFWPFVSSKQWNESRALLLCCFDQQTWAFAFHDSRCWFFPESADNCSLVSLRIRPSVLGKRWEDPQKSSLEVWSWEERMGQQPSILEDMDQTVEVLSAVSGRSACRSACLSVCLSLCSSSSGSKVRLLRCFSIVCSFTKLANSKFRNSAGQFPGVIFLIFFFFQSLTLKVTS